SRRPRSGFCGYSSFLGPQDQRQPGTALREIEHSGVKEQAGLLRADEISCHGQASDQTDRRPSDMATFLPSTKPVSLKPRRNPAMGPAHSAAETPYASAAPAPPPPPPPPRPAPRRPRR